jgi:hypothetical protein
VGRVKTWSRISEITADEKDEADFAG